MTDTLIFWGVVFILLAPAGILLLLQAFKDEEDEHAQNDGIGAFGHLTHQDEDKK